MQNLSIITKQVRQAGQELLQTARLKKEQILVVGCSTSEIQGQKIGTHSNLAVAHAVLDGLVPLLADHHLYLAIQSCEHLNRALVIEAACGEKYHWEEVAVIPHEQAGGALAAAAMQRFNVPMVVESLQAHAGMDIGDTFIGMHLKRVVVPVRSSLPSIGQAHLTMARTRPMYIGGERARYQ
ncbi:MAG TPA: TIGR01440 family protein [Syntrophomonadaceae bacterium]|jgi:uncharacterized protein (TIGR01440 family)|nr:TIGR01440 family protein [Syntrophomonadaceae bacterium]